MTSARRTFLIRRTIFDSTTFAFLAASLLIAFVQPSNEEMLMLNRNALIFLGLWLMGLGMSVALNEFGIYTAGQRIFESKNRKNTGAQGLRSFATWQIIVTVIVTFIVGLAKTKFSFNELLNEDGFAGAVRLFSGMAHPNFHVLPKAIINIIETIFMAYMATVLAIPFAFILSFLCARNLMKGPVAYAIYLILRTFLNFTRSVEALIWAIIFSVWVGIGPFAGMLALWIHTLVSLAKQYSEMVESINEGPIEGIQATGANRAQTIWFAIVPQVLLQYIALTVYRWDLNVRMATVIGLVGGGGIGTMLIQYQGQAMWPEVGCIILVIAVVVWMMDQASAALRESLK